MLAIVAISAFSCDRVSPGFIGVKSENYGQEIKDYRLVMGRVWTAFPGVDLYEVPITQSSGELNTTVSSNSSTQFEVTVEYLYSAIPDSAIKIVRNYRQYQDSEESWFDTIEKNSLEKEVKSAMFELANQTPNDTFLYNRAGFTERLKGQVAKIFKANGFELATVTVNIQLDGSLSKVVADRDASLQRVQLLENQQKEQETQRETERQNAAAKVEIAKLEAEASRIKAQSLTPVLLQELAIRGWIEKGCPMPYSLGSNHPATFLLDAKK